MKYFFVIAAVFFLMGLMALINRKPKATNNPVDSMAALTDVCKQIWCRSLAGRYVALRRAARNSNLSFNIGREAHAKFLVTTYLTHPLAV